MNMKLNKFVNLLVIGVVVCIAASGCTLRESAITAGGLHGGYTRLLLAVEVR